MSTLITPTIGRVVWYWPSQQEIDAKSISIFDHSQPLAATVAYVFGDRLVNLSVVDHAGAQFRRTSVQLLQEGDERPPTSWGPFAEWMPYQRAQHEKQAAEAPVFVAVDPAAPGADQTVETKAYTDGTTATGTAPLPDESPAQQAVAIGIKEGDVGLYTPYNSGEGEAKPAVNAVVTKVWTDTCVNVETETGEQQTSALVYRGDTDRPAGHYFEPGAGKTPEA